MDNKTSVTNGRRTPLVDGMSARPNHQTLAKPPERRVYFTPRPAPKEHKWLEKLQLPLMLLAGIAGGVFADNLIIGLALLSAYGVFAFITRVPSRTTFTLTLLILGAISIMLLLKPTAVLISNFATYAFVLLLIGVVTLGRESKLPKRMPRKYRR